MKFWHRHWWVVVLGLIIMIGSFVRLYRIGQVPYGYAYDEAGITYDAWSIALWHRDQFANFMPLTFKSFGDFKPPLLIYTLALIDKVIGLHLVTIRVVSAIAGIASILVMYWFGLTLFKDKSIGLGAAAVVAFSPWSIQLSRVGFEQNLTFFLGLTGIWLLIKALSSPRLWLISAFFMAASCYTFHTAKIFIPLVLILFGWFYRKLIRKYRKWAWVSLGFFMVLIIPLVYSSLVNQAAQRALTLILFDQSGRWQPFGQVIRTFANNVVNEVSPNFWVNGWDAVSIRHAVPGYGVLLWPFFGLLLLSSYFCWKTRDYHVGWLWLLLLTGLAPAIVSEPTPHVLRSQFALIGAALLVGWTTFRVLSMIRSMKLKVLGSIIMVIWILANLGGYLFNYFTTYAVQSALDYQFGYEEVLAIAALHPTLKTVITDRYGQPYIYTLLYNRITPQQFVWGALNKYEFRPIHWPENQRGTLYIGTPQEIPITDPAVIETVVVPQTHQIAWVIAQK